VGYSISSKLSNSSKEDVMKLLRDVIIVIYCTVLYVLFCLKRIIKKK